MPHLQEVVAKTEIIYGDDNDEEKDADDEYDEDFDDDGDGGVRVNVQDGFVNTRKAALTALGSLAEHTKAAFFPYLETIMTTIIAEPEGILWSLVDSVRAEALSIMQTFVTCACEAQGITENAGKGEVLTLPPVVVSVTSVALKYCIQAMEDDTDKDPVGCAIESVAAIIERVGKSL